jgi:hypothetical protein
MDNSTPACLTELRAKLMLLSVANMQRMCDYAGVPFGTADKIRRGTSLNPRFGNVLLLMEALKARKQWERKV